MRKHIMLASHLLKRKTVFTSKNYWDVIMLAGKEDLIYMDPPYQGVCGNRDTRYLSSVQFCEFIEALEQLNSRGISYIVSYDGRTGTKVYGRALPEKLGLAHLELHAGRSTQATLLGRDDVTYESLYLSPALSEKLSLKKTTRTNIRAEQPLFWSEIHGQTATA
jgi:DNA adenine methylase